MAFAFRLILVFGKFVVIAVVLCAVILGTIWLLNKLIQFTADQLGYEVKDFFVWVREKLPERKNKKETTDGTKS